MAQLIGSALPVVLSLLQTVFACSAAGEQVSKKGAKAMADDPYFGRLGMQLIHCPASSRELLTAANGHRPAADPGAAFPVTSAKSWVKAILRPEYAYPGDTLFVAIRQENSMYDVVRASYRVHDQQIEIAQSLHVISITFRSVPSSASNLQRAKETAGRFLQLPEEIQFNEEGAYENGTWGRKPQPSGAPGWPFWVDEIRWWCSGRDVGFVTLKAAGGPTQALISPSEGLNLHWFD